MGPGIRRGIRGTSASRPTLAQRIIDTQGVGAGGGAQALFIAEPQYLTLSSGKVTTWTDATLLGRDATQGTDANRFTYNATGLNGKPSVTAAGTHVMSTAAINLTSFESIAITLVFLDTNTTIYVAADFADAANGMCRHLHSEAAGRLAASGRAAAGITETRSAGSFTMATAGVVTATVDYTLSTQSTRIRHNGIDVSTTFVNDVDVSGQAVANGILRIGNRMAADLGLSGELAACLVSCWTTALPTSQVAAGENVFINHYGIS